MQPRTLDSIITELGTTFNPQIDAIKQRQAQIPGQVQAEETALQAKQTQAFDDILGGARRRGTGVAFGGIPLSEQAKYTSTEFLPALARMKSTAREQQMSLDDAINSIYEKRNTFGYQIKQNEDQLFESRRQFDANMAWQREQEANRLREAARAAAASGGGGFAPSMGGLSFGGGGGAPTGAGAKAPAVPAHLQSLFNQMFINSKGQKWDDKALKSDYGATLRSANNGNARDKQKIQLYHSVRPDLFGASLPAQALANGGSLRF